MKKEYKYIAFEGPIGVGKTSLAKICNQHFRSKLILEEFEKNPFLEDFYTNMRELSFHTQIFFLFSRYQQQIEKIHEFDLFNSHIIADYTFYKDKIFAFMNLSNRELPIYEKVYQVFEPEVTKPDMIFFLNASVDSLMRQIKQRSREFEKTLSREYLQSLVIAYDHFFDQFSDVPVKRIDTTNIDFINCKEGQARILEMIENELSGKSRISELLLT